MFLSGFTVKLKIKSNKNNKLEFFWVAKLPCLISFKEEANSMNVLRETNLGAGE